jgi:uncharacterized protein (DUF983 family)
MAARAEVLARLRQGRRIHVFPEGTRTRTGELAERVSLRLLEDCHAAGIPVVPCAVYGTERALPPDRPRAAPLQEVWLDIGEPREPSGEDDAAAFARSCWEEVRARFERLRADVSCRPPRPGAEAGVERRHRGALGAVLGGRCPACREGRVFAGRLRMHERCPACSLVFEREPGYFVGAMYVSYALAVPTYLLLVAAVHLVAPRLPLLGLLAVAAALFLPAVPFLFRTSRVLWLHLDWLVDPGRRRP